MITAYNWIVLGAAGRNVGKTAFACALIRRLAAVQPVVGVKITAIRERNGECPRGGSGCGVCTSLSGNFCLERENGTHPAKDTGRMLAAGARNVLWLRVMASHLEDGIRDLFANIPPGVAVVAESNSARQVLQPGVFLVIREAGSLAVKETCRAVMGYADRIVEFAGSGWDTDPAEVEWAGDRWWLRPRASAVILAGGASRRMGTDKGMLDARGQPLIRRIADQLAYFPERLVGTGDAGRYGFLGLPLVPDRQPGQGPSMGILSCMARASYDLCFVTGCDIPTLDRGFVMHLLSLADGYDAVVPRHADGRSEPLLAVYRKSIIPALEAASARGERRIMAALAAARVRTVDIGDLDWYENLNTMEDYRQWLDRTEML